MPFPPFQQGKDSMKRTWILAFAVSMVSYFGIADERPDGIKHRKPAKSPHSIAVQFSGPLCVGVVSNGGVDLNTMKLASANVEVAGTIIHLDWVKSDKIRDELIWWSLPRAGDIRGPHAAVTGTMVFKPLKEVREAVQPVRLGITLDTPVPVVVVESINVYLARPGSATPSGPQHDRKLIEADSEATEQ
jgi:hypothetical protein